MKICVYHFKQAKKAVFYNLKPNLIDEINVKKLIEKGKTIPIILIDNSFLISKTHFLAILMEEWRLHLENERKIILNLFHQFDENGDGVLELGEFLTLINAIGEKFEIREAAKFFLKVLLKFFIKFRHFRLANLLIQMK